jgi:hypothetical protein
MGLIQTIGDPPPPEDQEGPPGGAPHSLGTFTLIVSFSLFMIMLEHLCLVSAGSPLYRKLGLALSFNTTGKQLDCYYIGKLIYI